jgi:hypothetical protein
MSDPIELDYMKALGKFGATDIQVEKDMGDYMARKFQDLIIRRYGASGLKNRTGALRQSLQVRYNAANHTVSLGIMVYGIFNSYGVGPKVKKGKIYDIDEWVRMSMGISQRKFSYEASYRKYGIRSRKFLPGDNAIEEILEDFLKSYEQTIK